MASSKTTFWGEAVSRIFAGAEEIKEDWGKKTVSFNLTNSAGSLAFDLNAEKLSVIKETFGTLSIWTTTSPDTRYSNDADYGNMIGVTMQVTLSNVNFPKRP